MTGALNNYHARMLRVLDHVDQHLDGDLDLEAVSGVAAFSKFHFHRQFKATFGVSLHRYVQLARMRRASQKLTDGEGISITDIALDAGYGEVFPPRIAPASDATQIGRELLTRISCRRPAALRNSDAKVT